MCSVKERVEQLRREIGDLRKEVKDLKDTLMQQNELIITLLSKRIGRLGETIKTEITLPPVEHGNKESEFSCHFSLENVEDFELSRQTGMLDETIEIGSTLPAVDHGNKVSTFCRRFPLETIEDLGNFELEINKDNEKHIVDIIQKLLSPQGLSKNIVNVLSDNIIMESNMDGHHYKTRLLNYPKTIDVLFLATRKDNNYSSKMFLDDLKRSLRVVKNRCYSNTRRARQKLLLNEDPDQEELPEQSAKQTFTVRTEETYFPPCSS